MNRKFSYGGTIHPFGSNVRIEQKKKLMYISVISVLQEKCKNFKFYFFLKKHENETRGL
jgi:hypothetical protein